MEIRKYPHVKLYNKNGIMNINTVHDDKYLNTRDFYTDVIITIKEGVLYLEGDLHTVDTDYSNLWDGTEHQYHTKEECPYIDYHIKTKYIRSKWYGKKDQLIYYVEDMFLERKGSVPQTKTFNNFCIIE